ncbi:MAG: ribonuclease H-like domain-containing protein [Pseudomonadota bacterium]
MAGSLASRLGRLQRDAGGSAAEPSPLAERLDALRRRSRRSRDLGQTIPGEPVADGVLRLEHRQPFGPWIDADVEPLGLGAGASMEARFVDTETTGLAGGTGTRIFLFGAAWRDGEDLVVCQLLLLRPGAEAAYWEVAESLLPQHFGLVSYNGKSFDWPLVATRQRLSGRPVRQPNWHVDLVHPVRRAFGSRWPDCRLQTCEARLLGAPRSNDLGGEFAPWAYREFLAGRDAGPLRRIIDHHRQDMISLVELLPVVGRCLGDPGAFGADAAAVGRGWLEAGDLARAAAVLAGHTCAEARLLHASVLRRQERWADAAEIWSALAGEGEARAVEAMAKYCEHRTRDLEAARGYARQLVACRPGDAASTHRLNRIERRLGKQPTD